MRRPALRRAVPALAVAGVIAAAPAVAGAHPRLVASEPADGSALAAAPGEVRLRFDEPISERFRQVRVLDAAGEPVPGTTPRGSGDPREVLLRVPELRRGTYEVDWEVLSEQDGHVTGGALAFGVRVQPPPGARTPAGAAPAAPEAVLRWADLVLLAGLIGGTATSLLLAAAARGRVAPAVAATATRRVLTGAAWTGGLAIVLGGVLLARQVGVLLATLPAGASPADALAGLPGTRWGALWLVRELLLVGLVASVLVLRRGSRRRPLAAILPVATVLAVALFAVRALGGHAAVVSPSAPAVVAQTLHGLAAALWIGGVLALILALGSARGSGKGAPAALAHACRRPFALAAAGVVAVLCATGLYAAGAQVASPDALLTTFYGRALIAKAALLLAAGAFGLANFAALRRAGSSRLLLAEAMTGLYVLLAAAMLAAAAPPRGPEFAPPRTVPAPTLVAQAGDVLVSATARPNRPGANVLTVVAASSRRPPPAPIDRVVLHVTPATGGPAIAVKLREFAPGRWTGGARLDKPGRWRMTVALHRGDRRLATAFAWSVAPPDPARPVVVSARPLAPIVDVAALLVLVAAAAAWPALAAARRLRTPMPTLSKEAT